MPSLPGFVIRRHDFSSTIGRYDFVCEEAKGEGRHHRYTYMNVWGREEGGGGREEGGGGREGDET